MVEISFAKKLEISESLSEIFELVKEVVRRTIKRERAGLMLGLADLGTKPGWFVGAFHPVGSNIIVMNKTPLRIIEAARPELYNSYCFHILLHEYLHTIGILDEEYAKELTYLTTRKVFGEYHPASLIAKDFSRFFPEMIYAGLSSPGMMEIDIVSDFDKSNTSYIG